MKIMPTHVSVQQATTYGIYTQPIAPVQQGTAEYDAQALFMLGYLANVAQVGYAPTDPGSGAYSEIFFLQKQIVQMEQYCSAATQQLLYASGYNGAIHQLPANYTPADQAALATALSNYVQRYKDFTATAILQWTSGQYSGNSASFDIQSATDVTTVFYYFMFISSLYLPGMSPVLGNEAEAFFFSQDMSGEMNMIQWSACFLGAFCNNNPWLGGLLASFVPPAQTGRTNYNQFLSLWNTSTSSFNYTQFGAYQNTPERYTLVYGELEIAMSMLRPVLKTLSYQ